VEWNSLRNSQQLTALHLPLSRGISSHAAFPVISVVAPSSPWRLPTMPQIWSWLTTRTSQMFFAVLYCWHLTLKKLDSFQCHIHFIRQTSRSQSSFKMSTKWCISAISWNGKYYSTINNFQNNKKRKSGKKQHQNSHTFSSDGVNIIIWKTRK